METVSYAIKRATYFPLISLRLRGESMDPPHLTEHGAERQGEAGRHRPRSSLADYQKLPRRHEPTVNSYKQHCQEAAYYSHQHYSVGAGMRRVNNSGRKERGDVS